MAMVEPEGWFPGGGDPPRLAEEARRAAEKRCLEAEQRCFMAERRRFEAERRRQRLEALLAQAYRAGAHMEQIVAELKGLVARMRRLAGPQEQAPVSEAGAHGGETMVDALSDAIARLRANVEAVGEPPEPAPAKAPEPPSAAHAAPSAPAIVRKPHKHSMSLIGRWRMRRKQRRSR